MDDEELNHLFNFEISRRALFVPDIIGQFVPRINKMLRDKALNCEPRGTYPHRQFLMAFAPYLSKDQIDAEFHYILKNWIVLDEQVDWNARAIMKLTPRLSLEQLRRLLQLCTRSNGSYFGGAGHCQFVK